MSCANNTSRAPLRLILGGYSTLSGDSKRSSTATPPTSNAPLAKKRRGAKFIIHSDADGHLSSGWSCVNKPAPKAKISGRKVQDTEAQFTEDMPSLTTRKKSGRKAQDKELKFTEEDLKQIMDKDRVTWKVNQERIILKWMKMNNTRTKNRYLTDTFEELLESLEFKNSLFSLELRTRLRNKTEQKIGNLARKLERIGALEITNKSCEDEVLKFMDWTDIWLSDNWDGSVEEPPDEKLKFEDEFEEQANMFERGFQSKECTGNQPMILEAEPFAVQEPDMEHDATENEEGEPEHHSNNGNGHEMEVYNKIEESLGELKRGECSYEDGAFGGLGGQDSGGLALSSHISPNQVCATNPLSQTLGSAEEAIIRARLRVPSHEVKQQFQQRKAKFEATDEDRGVEKHGRNGNLWEDQLADGELAGGEYPARDDRRKYEFVGEADADGMLDFIVARDLTLKLVLDHKIIHGGEKLDVRREGSPLRTIDARCEDEDNGCLLVCGGALLLL